MLVAATMLIVFVMSGISVLLNGPNNTEYEEEPEEEVEENIDEMFRVDIEYDDGDDDE